MRTYTQGTNSDDLLKAVKAVTRTRRYYDTEARTGITKTDCTKPRETQGTKHAHKKLRNYDTEARTGITKTDCML